MRPEDRYDSLCQFVWELYRDKYGPDMESETDWHLAKEVIRAESAFNPRAISPVGAKGLMQLMQGTWGEGFEKDWMNAETNMHRGIAHLWYLWKLFRDEHGTERWKFALGAYNAGQGNVIKAQLVLKARGKETDVWENIAEVLPQITGDHSLETINYVKKISENTFV